MPKIVRRILATLFIVFAGPFIFMLDLAVFAKDYFLDNIMNALVAIWRDE